MSAATDQLADLVERIGAGVEQVVDGLTRDQLTRRIEPDANTIAWLTWHLLRVQDDHVADVAGTGQVWTSGDWERRAGLPFAPTATGYGQSGDEVAALRLDADLIAGYARAVTEATLAYVAGLDDDDFDRIVDDAWEPPVTLGVRLASVINDDLKHLGQAEFVRGLL